MQEGVSEVETLSEAIRRLEGAGYRDSFQPAGRGLRSLETGRVYAPESLHVDEIVRFEGDTDPQDEAVVFALRSAGSGVCGTLVASYGAQADPESADLIDRLHADAETRRR